MRQSYRPLLASRHTHDGRTSSAATRVGPILITEFEAGIKALGLEVRAGFYDDLAG
jgi:hypothetical protein